MSPHTHALEWEEEPGGGAIRSSKTMTHDHPEGNVYHKHPVQDCRMGDILKECVVHHSPMDFATGPCWFRIEQNRMLGE